MSKDTPSSHLLPFFTPQPHSGLSCPTDSYANVTVDLERYLETQRPSTFFVKVCGKSMVNAGIMDQAILVASRDRPPKHDDIVIAAIDGELSRKILDTRAQVLRTANTYHRPVSVNGHDQVTVLGVVTHAINPF
ncbi:MAG: hypothetical protein OXU66_12650 [Gammaproteobacteria bacterium]|nr:hypothetical protein [Gammaproteobacteria bacterium]